MIQLTRSGLRMSAPDEVSGLADSFSRNHAVRVPRFVEPVLLETVSRLIASARFRERVHDHLDPPAVDLALDDPDAHSRLLVLFNDAGLFRFIDAVTGCGSLGGFEGTAYRMLPHRHHLASWHDDVKDGRMAAMTLNLSPHGYAGGVLQLRQTGSAAVLHEVANIGYGDAVVFRIGRGFEHRVTPIEEGPPKIAWAGWFRREPAFLDRIRSKQPRLA